MVIQGPQAGLKHRKDSLKHAERPDEPSEARLRAGLGTALLVLAVGTGVLFADPITVGATVGLVAMLYLFRVALFSWPGAAVALVLVICLVPARRYTLPVSLPFAAEPYRLVVLFILALVIAALLIDPAFRWRRLAFGGPVAFYLATQLISIGANVPGLVRAQLAPNAVISLVSLLIICAVFIVARQLLQDERTLHLVLMTAALCGALVGALAAVERVVRVNAFIQFFALLPLHELSEEESVFIKAGTARAFGPAQHPIALAVFLIMLIPIAVYLAKYARWPRNGSWRELFWIGCAMLMLVGMLSAVSRTAFVSLAVMVVAFALLRPAGIPRLLLYGVLGMLAGLAISARNIIAMVTELLDPEALIASQMTSPGWTGSGRLADLGPSLEQAAAQPFVGTGLGSRVTIGPTANAFILDDQYLGTLLESGLVGLLGMAALLLVPTARLIGHQRSAAPPADRDLALAVAVSIIGYTVALFFFDGFSFIQTLLTFFLLLACGSWVVSRNRDEALAPARVVRLVR